MADIKTLQDKVDNLKTLIERDSITPVSLGTLLDYFIEVIAGIRSTLESSDSNILSQITDLSTELTAKATRLEEGYKSADEGLSARITTNANNIAANASTIATHTEEITDLTAECRNLDEAFHSADEGLQKSIDANKASIAANASTIATHTEEISNLTAECRALDEAYHSADEQLSARINTNAAGITDNAAKIAENANGIAAVRLTAAANKLDLARINIVNFHGITTLAHLENPQSEQDRQEAVGKILFLSDVGYFGSIEDPTLPIGWHEDDDWDGERYNEEVDGVKRLRLDTIFRLDNNLYRGSIDGGSPALVKYADINEVNAVSQSLESTNDTLRDLTDTVNQNFEQADKALRDALASLVPTGVTATAPTRLTLGNAEPNFVVAALEPEGVAQNFVFITDNRVAAVAPDGKLTLIAPGHAEIYVVPTLNTSLAKKVIVEVVEPTVMGVSIPNTSSGGEGEEGEAVDSEMRLLSDGAIRFN